MGKKLRKEYPIGYSLLIGEDLQQANNQILLIILLKEFIKLNLNMDKKIESEKRVELNSNIVSPVSNTQTLKVIYQNQNVYVAEKITKKT